jgi:hypothetical protein
MADMRVPFIAPFALFATIALGAQSRPGDTQQPGRSAQPARDTPVQEADAAAATGTIAGRVVAADTGRPVRRARVLLSGPAVQGGRGALTDEQGFFTLTELPEGRYTLAASRTGFITLSYGQRRPLQAGTPIQLANAQQLTGVDFRLPRGGVIAGHVLDESGEPLPGATVRVLRYAYAQGNRELAPMGNAQTDDLGAYRVWGLDPGDYYVTASAAAFGGGRGFPPSGSQPRSAGAAGDEGQVGYAPTFYPGVPSVGEARAVRVGLSSETPAIDFSVLLVRTARIAGRVVNPDGTAVTAGNVSLTPESGGSARGMTFGSRINWDGAFAFNGVAPGRYVLRARSDDSVEAQYAVQSLTVGPSDLDDVTVILDAGATIRGSVVFQGTAGQGPDASQLRVAASLVDGTDNGSSRVTRVDRDGNFNLTGIEAGAHLLRTQAGPRGWTLKSVQVDGRDFTDAPLDLSAGQILTGVSLVLTSQFTEINGTIADERGTPVTEFTLLVFADDESLWRPLSRHIMTTRPDQNGHYQLRGLPPGDYYLAAVDPAEQGEWFEPAYLAAHRSEATRLRLGEGEVKTQNFSISTR